MANISEKLRSYFLGELKEEAAIRLEDEYLGDATKFAELSEAENDLLDDYISDKLPPNSRKSFEENYLNSPFRRQRLEFAKTLSEYLQKKVETSQIAEKKDFGWLDIFSFWRIGVAFASLLLLFLGGFWLLNNSSQNPQTEVVLNKTPEILPSATPQITPKSAQTPVKPKTNSNEINTNVSPTPVPAPKPSVSPTPIQKPTDSPATEDVKPNQTVILALSTIGMRDGGKTPQVVIGKETKNVVLRLSQSETEAKNFQVKIINADGQPVFQTKNVRLIGKNISLSLSANLLQNDDYVAEVSTMNPNGELEKVASYNFRVIKK